jgi:hypothetical protein
LSQFQYRWLTRHDFIPLVELFAGPDRVIRKGRYEGTGCYYRTALLNALVRIRPRVCLEIGTYKGVTSRVFEHYFSKYEPKGVLITTDIRRYADISSDRVRQVIVYPHVANITHFHDVTREQMLPDADAHVNDSLEANCAILRSEMKKIGAGVFDFSFVDGDHQRTSFLRDLEIVRALSRPPHYALLDDTKDETHECATIYQEELINRVSHYDFDDWPIFVGVSLIWSQSGNRAYTSPKTLLSGND